MFRKLTTCTLNKNYFFKSAQNSISTMWYKQSNTHSSCIFITSTSFRRYNTMSQNLEYPLPDVHAFDNVLPNITLTQDDQESIDRFKKFLQIPSITSDCNNPAISSRIHTYLQDEAKSLGLEFKAIEMTPGWFIYLLTWEGTEPEVPSILLNSHYDVVPIIKENWHWPPFDAIELDNGDIIARGTQDMKCVCVQYLEAIRRLKNGNYIPRRTIHLAFQPDEELGGALGMGKWVNSEEFKALNIAFALDEGIASTDDSITVFYGERTVWWLGVKSIGPTGHGSRFIENTSIEKLMRTITKFLNYRTEQQALLGGDATSSTLASTSSHTCEEGSGCKHSIAKKLGDVVTLNLTVLKAGVTSDGVTYAYNVIPKESYAGFDVRIPPHVNLKEFEAMLLSWLEPDMTLEFVVKSEVNNMTSINEEENPFWKAFKTACSMKSLQIDPQIFPAATDGRYLRNMANIPVIGFSPIRNQPILLHDHDERLNKKSFIEGIHTFESVIQAISSVEPFETKE